MKLRLNSYFDPKATLQSWSIELRKRLFSSPDEFVWTAYRPAIRITGGQTLEVSAMNCAYLQHGKLVHIRLYVQGTIATPGIAFTNGTYFTLPVKARTDGNTFIQCLKADIEENAAAEDPAKAWIFASGTEVVCIRYDFSALADGIVTWIVSGAYEAA